MVRAPWSLLLIATLVVACTGSLAARERGQIIEDFEGTTLDLVSYPDQDQEPDAWALSNDAYAGSQALFLDGNTWKIQALATAAAVTDSTVWSVAIRVDRIGEMQAIGVGDGVNELFYTFWGRDLPEDTNWWTVYQGAYDQGEWRVFLLPIGEDWTVTFGAPPTTITSLLYVNDADAGNVGEMFIDEIRDVTLDLPHAPRCRILSSVQEVRKAAGGLLSVDVQFEAKVFDQDSDTFTYDWDFGDGEGSDVVAPFHTFLVAADHPWTVGITVTDPEGLAGGDTCRVKVDEGTDEWPLTVNFVGDVFTGRGYENNGGIIDTYGVEALFEPTVPIFGDAADINVANLEVSYTDRGERHPTKSVVFRSKPENITGIQYAGVDLVTLGNNHIIDYGEIGMLDTMDGLDELGIPYCGAGTNEYFALLPAYYGASGLRLSFLGLCNRTGRLWNYQPFLDAGYNKPGFAYLLPDNLQKSIDGCRDQSDVVIVQTHSGSEYDTAPPPDGRANTQPIDVEAIVPQAGAPEFKFRNEPTPGERELRRLALDYGADILINHHPHVLQGFESYNGRLIAHSLGNFIFDLYYPETMPTMVLTLEIDDTGIIGQTMTPAWINHWIPQPATGTLARHINERLADYSRPMNAFLVPEADGIRNRIYLDRSAVDSTVTSHQSIIELEARDGFAVSAPLPVGGDHFLSGLDPVIGDGSGWEIRWGRDILWFGGFESEGADLWDVNTEDEWLDTEILRTGALSLGLQRKSSDTDQTGTDLEKHLPCDPAKQHSALGWLRGENAAEARVMTRFYNTRYNETPLSSVEVGERLQGDSGWTQRWTDMETPDDALYFELRCGIEPPAADNGRAWYDDLAMVEWEDWMPVHASFDVPSPNSFRFVQVRRAGDPDGPVTVVWRETTYGDVTTGAPEVVPSVNTARLACYPNPCNPRTTVQLDLPMVGARDCMVALFDLRGRRVALLHQGPLEGVGPHGFTWDGKDDGGRELASGVYLARAVADGRTATGKVVLVR